MRRRYRKTRIRMRAVVIAVVLVAAAVGIPVAVLRGAINLTSLAGENLAEARQAAAPSSMDMPGMTNPAPVASAPGAGPVTAVDKTFLTKVRQAGLWEMPAGRLAQTNASSEAVKRAGLHLLDGHSKLDELVREDAAILGVELPDKASDEQQGWVRQLSEAHGADFDRLFVNLLRASHGKIFATIAEVRAGTHNALIRRHATEANQTVLDHMQVLEDTGLVDPKTLSDVEAAVAPR
jgi:predicted outer membrane protein